MTQGQPSHSSSGPIPSTSNCIFLHLFKHTENIHQTISFDLHSVAGSCYHYLQFLTNQKSKFQRLISTSSKEIILTYFRINSLKRFPLSRHVNLQIYKEFTYSEKSQKLRYSVPVNKKKKKNHRGPSISNTFQKVDIPLFNSITQCLNITNKSLSNFQLPKCLYFAACLT